MFSELSIYASLWSKYRPAILQLMSAAGEAPQKYQLYSHEFKALNSKEKGGYSFTLEASKGKAVNNIKTSAVAKDLLQVLQQSKRAMELMNEVPFELRMDKSFVLHISRKEEVKVEAPVVAEEATHA